ncbi:DNA polymerase I, partial [Acinetobacter baumannii]|nr:DNA polymerase I [Acinetobacter baumannii]
DWETLRLPTDPSFNIAEKRAIFTELEFKSEIASLNHPFHPSNNGNFKAAEPAQNAVVAAIKTSQDSKNTANKQWHTVTSQADFDTLIQRLGAAKHFVIDTETTDVNWQHAELVGLSFALQSHEAYSVPVAHVDEMGNRIEQLTREDVLAQLKPILQNPQIGKIGQHL